MMKFRPVTIPVYTKENNSLKKPTQVGFGLKIPVSRGRRLRALDSGAIVIGFLKFLPKIFTFI